MSQLTRMEEHHCRMIEAKAALSVENEKLRAELQSSREDAERLAEALRELLSIVRVHSSAINNNFAWAEVDFAEEALAAHEAKEK